MEVKLKTKHIIMFSKLVAKMDVKIDSKEKDATKLGAQTVVDLITKIHKAEPEFYELIGSLCGYAPEKAAETDVEELYEVLSEVTRRIINFIQSRRPSTISRS